MKIGHTIPRKRRSCRGFTLLELLAVIVIIAILLGIVTKAAQMVIGVAREKRLTTTCRALETALARYRDEYGSWPIDFNYANGNPTNEFYFTVYGETNKFWFTKLRATPANADNPKKIRFVDETTIFTDLKGARNDSRGRPIHLIPLHLARELSGLADEPLPFVAVNKRRQTLYFNIRINVDLDTVQVGTAP